MVQRKHLRADACAFREFTNSGWFFCSLFTLVTCRCQWCLNTAPRARITQQGSSWFLTALDYKSIHPSATTWYQMSHTPVPQTKANQDYESNTVLSVKKGINGSTSAGAQSYLGINESGHEKITLKCRIYAAETWFIGSLPPRGKSFAWACVFSIKCVHINLLNYH